MGTVTKLNLLFLIPIKITQANVGFLLKIKTNLNNVEKIIYKNTLRQLLNKKNMCDTRHLNTKLQQHFDVGE